MKPALWTKADGLVALLIVLYTMLLAALPTLLPASDFARIFSEQGPFETLSIATWMFAALVVLVATPPLGPVASMFSLLFIACAAREADWHKKFTADSILKSNYYRYTDAPGGEKVLAALAALVFIGMIVGAGFIILRFLVRQDGWRSGAGIWIIIGGALIVLGKVLDRAPAELALAGFPISTGAKLYASAFEEGLEMIHPLILAWAVWRCRSGPSFLSRAGHRA
jgi:hypothetical protein